MTENVKFQGRLREKELEAEKLELKIRGLRDAMRDGLDPFEPIADLPLDVVAAQAVDAAELQIQLLQVLEDIRAIKKTLGK